MSTVGAENLIIIDTPNALLVVDRNCVQEAKHIYSELKAQVILYRAKVIEYIYRSIREARFKIKRIEVKSCTSIRLQMHYYWRGHWIVMSGGYWEWVKRQYA